MGLHYIFHISNQTQGWKAKTGLYSSSLILKLSSILQCVANFSHLNSMQRRCQGGGLESRAVHDCGRRRRAAAVGHCSLQGHWPRSPPASLTSPTQKCSLTFCQNPPPCKKSLTSIPSDLKNATFSPAGQLQTRRRAILAPLPINWFWLEHLLHSFHSTSPTGGVESTTYLSSCTPIFQHQLWQ